MANTRPHNYPDAPADITGYKIAVDKSGETSQQKIGVEKIFDAIQANSDNIQTNADNIASNDAQLQTHENLLAELTATVTWRDATKVSSKLTSEAFLRYCKLGKIVYVTGIIKCSSAPSEDEVLFTLDSIPNFTETFYFSAGDGNSDENYEMKALTGSKNIVSGGGTSTGTEAHFGTSIPII